MQLLFTFILVVVSVTLPADEGMWEPYQMSELKNEVRQAGFRRNINSISSPFEYPMNAIVSLGGCSASFVSPNGLIATNYHCIEGSYLQYNSSQENNLFETGFVARSLDEEKRSAPGARVYITLSSSDITEKVLAGIADTTENSQRANIIEANRKKIINECETSAEIECRVRSFFSGETFKLEKVRVIKDVRLVYAPPASIGEYGGEIDNWMYPRHTGDFALLRAYVSADGTSQEFNTANVPYASKNYLKISARGVDEGDFVMVLGYPGRTNRLLTMNEIDYDLTVGFQGVVDYLEHGIALIDEHTNQEDGSALKYRGTKSGYENYYKKISGQIDGADNFQLLQYEQANWNKFLTFVENELSSEDQEYLARLLSLIDTQQARALPNRYYGRSTLISTAKRLYRNAFEQEKPNAERKPGYQDRDQERLLNGLRGLSYRFDPRVDQAIFLDRLLTYASFAPELRRPVYSAMLDLDAGAAAIRSKVDQIYSSQYQTPEAFLELAAMTIEQMNASADPLLVLARETFAESLEYEADAESEGAEKQLLKSKFIKMLRAFYESEGRSIYADANGTLRVTYGNVKAVTLEDGLLYQPFTTLEGIPAKHSGQEPFNAPQKLLKLIDDKDYGKYEVKALGSVPVNFIANLDITNGNSGSATINRNFELVGLAFDGMLETIIADYRYIPQARTISVDSRYMLWTLDKFHGAENILNELTITN